MTDPIDEATRDMNEALNMLGPPPPAGVDVVNLALSAGEMHRVFAGQVVRVDVPDADTGEPSLVLFIRFRREGTAS